ncbi:hypothetical protein CspeluHIS016_0103630 [Cutaneotrichosporon spelunceum]|uniref:DNA repair protein RAD50 n=1 Tax=Cutaneotrichosporon spelunceum TaxID=1672016 RepID=A0AAD3TNE2_9TREE|nr:hypothetical protein CspeluHIS016_0103630 [Cutaneotrichosporon spelunceum]
MASLNKLAIRGIRSFDDKHVQVIEFYSPLTVIVGHNGSGKTTIIECLKYATTGDLPPNTKGGAFVHDPKMANEKEVKAQVRLRFWNVNRERMTVTRSLQVTTKKTGALTMKTLEGLLAKDDGGATGKRNTISTKCSELDEEVPLLLGVSKAILENVIFCHQEDSSWPLAEPAALKKKFDDIFEATKYTKALDNIKSLRKERTAEIKVDMERLKFLKNDKDRAQRMRQDHDDMVAKEHSRITEAEDLKGRFHVLKEENEALYKRATAFQHIFERHDNLKARKDMLTSNRDRMMDGMNVLNDTTEELMHKFQNFETHLKSIEGKRDQQIETYERNIREREASVRELSKTFNIPGYDYSSLEDAKVMDFVDRLQEMLRKAEADLKRLQTEGLRKERELQSELDDLANKKTTALATKSSKEDQIRQLQTRIRNMEQSFDSFSSVDADISVLENDVSSLETRREALEQEVQEAGYDEQLRERRSAVGQKEAAREKLNSELTALNRQADTRAQLSIKRSELESKNAQVEASVQNHSARFKELTDCDLQPKTMEEKVTQAASRKDRELQETESAAAAKERTLSQLQTSTNIAKQSLKARSDELTKLERAFSDVLQEAEQSSVDDGIKECETEIGILKDELADSESAKKWYQRVLDTSKSKKKCMGCDRAIHENEQGSVQVYLQARLQKLNAADQSELQSDLHEWTAQLERLRAIQPSVERAKTLKRTEIPLLEQQIATDTAKLATVQEEVDEARQTVQTSKLAVRDLHAIKSAAAIMTRLVDEIDDLKASVQRLERDLQSTGSVKTVDDVQSEIEQIANEIKTLQRDMNFSLNEKELKLNTIRSIGEDLHRKTMRLTDLRSKQERRNLDEEQLKEQQTQLTKLQGELKELDVATQAASAPWREKRDALGRYRTERQEEEDSASMEVDRYQSSLYELEAKHRSCQAYVTEGNDRKLRENESHLESMRQEIQATKDRRAAVDKAVSALQEDVSRAHVTRRNLKSNLDFRAEERAIEKVQEEMEELDLEGAARDRRSFNHEYKQKMAEETDVQNRWQLCSGQVMQMAEERKRLEKTLASDYKNIDKLYRDQLIKTKAGEVANNDLEKYAKALDNAILKYHSIKMDEINDTIGHLWSKTYQGTDIDTLRIMSDHDEQSTSARKSYNYRVVMVKNQVELDMRGRCSAGQKVLASIIIRLALAESFGQGCGVLALDEPTTNLDQENINALAEALAEIIRERRRQANFQLIVITHDEGFLQRLAAQDVLDYYWRVSRDMNQKSVLERQRIGI